MRIVTGATARSNIALLYQDLNWESLDQRRHCQCLIMMYKIVNGLVPQYLRDLLPNDIEGGHRLRSQTHQIIRVPYARTESYKRSFIPHALALWNSLERDKRSLPNLVAFNSKRPYAFLALLWGAMALSSSLQDKNWM